MIEYLESAGPAGLAVVITAAALLIAGAVMIALSCTRKAFALYALLIWFPLYLGAQGTRASLKEVDRSPITHSEAIGPRNQQRLRIELRRPLNLGIGATALLLPLALTGMALAGKRDQKNGQPTSNGPG